MFKQLMLSALIALSALAQPANYEITAEAVVTKTKVELPIELRRACACESSYEGTAEAKPQQFNKNGSVRVHLNANGTRDYGSCMVNSVHDSYAKSKGFDYQNIEADNFQVALYVYKTQGIQAFYAYNPKTQSCVWDKQYL